MNIELTERDEEAYRERGDIHDLEYYDGPLMSVQMCVAHGAVHMVEVAVDHRMAETDGCTVFFRLSKTDLQAMLRILEEDPVETPRYCGQSPSGKRGPCPSCSP